MNLSQAYKLVVAPGLDLLPAKMNTPEAIVMLLTIGMQESRFKHRIQIGGPANGFYQFEKGGGVRGVLRWIALHDTLFSVLGKLEIASTTAVVYEAIVYNDPLATVMARLLLWTHPHAMPSLDGDHYESWNYYLKTWRPGKPHEQTWAQHRTNAIDFVKTL